MGGSVPLILPGLGSLYDALAPWAEMLARIVLGLALVPHGLRLTFGFFPNTGSRVLNLATLRVNLNAHGYKPATFWAYAISVLELVGGPLLALGLFTRPIALASFIFHVVSATEHWRFDGYFWNKLGLEYPMVWAAGTLLLFLHGGGPLSLDFWLFGHEF